MKAVLYFPILARQIALIVLCSTLIACSTSHSNMAPARTFKPGEASASMGYQIALHSQAYDGLVGLGKTVHSRVKDGSSNEPMSDEEFQTLLSSSLLLLFFSPGTAPELIGRAGVIGGLDLGVRYNGNVLKGDARYQLWESSDQNYAISAQFGYGHHLSPVTGAVEWLTLSDWNRSDYDMQLNFGYERGHILKLYFSPRMMISTIKPEPKFGESIINRMPEQYRNMHPSSFFSDMTMYYYGATGGMMIGYRYAFLALDLSFFRVNFQPRVLDNQFDFSGWTLAPNIGFVGMWR